MVALLVTFSAKAAFASEINSGIVVKLTNDARLANGEIALQQNDQLTKAAEEKAQDMINNNYFAHVSPAGKTPWFWIDKNGYDYRYAGENLAINFTNVEDQEQAWMNSPSHRENILNQKYQEIGVAVKQGVINGHSSVISVQVFGTNMSAVATIPSGENNQAVAGAENSKPLVSLAGNDFAKAGAVEGNFKFTTWQNQFESSLGLWAMAITAVGLLSFDAIIMVHRRHIKPILVAQALQNRKV